MLVPQSRPALCDPMDCSPPGSSVHGILQVKILEWVAIPSSRGSSQPRDQTLVSRIAGWFFTIWALGKTHIRRIYFTIWEYCALNFPMELFFLKPLILHIESSLMAQTVKASAYNAGNPGSIPGSGRSPGEGNGNPFQYPCLENPMDIEAW